MAHENTIYAVMLSLVIACKHVIGDIMAHKGLWTKGTSAVNNSYKALNLLVDSGKLIKGDGYFKLPGCKSEYKEHAQLLTKALAEIIKFNPTCKILREKNITEKALRPDAVVLLTRDDKACCFILEVCNNESEDYLTQKINTWNAWDGANKYLSDLFGEDIPFFQIVVSDNLKTFMEEL